MHTNTSPNFRLTASSWIWVALIKFQFSRQYLQQLVIHTELIGMKMQREQAGMSFAQPQAEAVSLKFVLVFVCIYNFKSPFLNFLTFGVVPSAEVSNYSKI